MKDTNLDQSLENDVIHRMQWVKGEKLGNVEIVQNIDEEWVYFKSGSRISTGILNEYMIPIDGEPLSFEDNLVIQNKTKANNVSNTKNSNYDNPIRVILNNQKVTDKVDIKFNFTLSFPKKDVLKVLDSAFDPNSEIFPELESYILSQVNESSIRKSLTESVKDLIKNKYKSFFKFEE